MPRSVKAKSPASPDAIAQVVINGDWVSPWENSSALAVVRTPSGQITAVNRSFALKFGKPTASWLDVDFASLLHPLDLLRWRAESARLFEAPHRVEFELRQRCALGWRWISWEEMALFAPDGSVSHVRAIGRDVTREKQAAEHAFMLGSAIEQSPVGVLITDLDGGAHYINQTFAQVSGYTLEDLIDRPVSLLREAHPSDEAYSGFLSKLREGKDWHGEAQLQRRDGSVLWEKLHVTPIRASDGAIHHLLCLREDITEQKRLEAQLRQAQKMESLGTLAGGIAHDFNNMLAIINGYAEVCINKPAIRQDEALHRYMREIHSATQRAVGLVQRILTFSRKTESRVAPLNLNKVLRELTNLLSETFPRTITFELDIDEALPLVLVDPNQMQQVVMNLCVNARDAMPKGGRLSLRTHAVPGASLLHIQGDPAKTYACLEVADSGCGMPPEIIQRIFEPFFTTKHDSGGTGLGLAVVYGIIYNHKGMLDVRSTVGEGTTFYAYFPIQSGQGEASSGAAVQATLAEFPVGTESILVVEDEVSLRNLLCNVLGPCGYTVHTARDGRDAVQQIRQEDLKIDAVILDLNMPGLHGIEVFRQLVKLRPEVRTLVVSGNITPEMKAELKDLGQKDFILKPYRLDEICGRLRRLLDAR